MGRVVQKIRCPNPDHSENTPSCAVYEDGSGYCFGCTTYFSNLATPSEPKEKKIEDVSKTLEYIQGLSIISHRGLQFPYNDTGYYIIWPSNTYYKCRRWLTNSTAGKYISPIGHRKPLFRLTGRTTKFLIIVEGEINALSIRDAGLQCDVISPGSATNFTDSIMRQNLTYLAPYSNIMILADSDAPGLKAGIDLKALVEKINPNVHINLMEEDCNEILATYGREALKKEIKRLAMSQGL